MRCQPRLSKAGLPGPSKMYVNAKSLFGLFLTSCLWCSCQTVFLSTDLTLTAQRWRWYVALDCKHCNLAIADVYTKTDGTYTGQMWLLLLWLHSCGQCNSFKTSSTNWRKCEWTNYPVSWQTLWILLAQKMTKSCRTSTLLWCGPNHRPTQCFIHRHWAWGIVMWCSLNLYTFKVSVCDDMDCYIPLKLQHLC